MATPTTLYEYYSSKGQSLPSLTERGVLYQQYGLGSSSSYTGSSSQNTALLNKLLSGSSTATTTTTPASTTSNSGTSSWYTPTNQTSSAYTNPLTVPSSSSTQNTSSAYNQSTTPSTNASSSSSTYTGSSIVDYLKSIGQDSSYSARAALASQYGITNYTGSTSQNTQLLSILRNPSLYNNLVSSGASTTQASNIAGSTTSPTTTNTGINGSALSSSLGYNNAVTSDYTYNATDLTTSNKVKLSDVAPDLVANNSYLANMEVSSGIAGIIALIQATNTYSDDYVQINEKLNNLLNNLGNQEEDFKAALEAEGVPETRASIQQLNLQIAQLTAEINQYDVSTSEGLNGIYDQAIPTGLLTGQAAAYQRQRDTGRASKAAQLSAYASLQQAYSQNLEIAISLAEASVNYKWSGIQTQISALQTQLSLAKAVMDSEAQKNLKIVEALLTEQQNSINEQKTEETALNNILVTAATKGAPLSLVYAAKATGSTIEASSMLSKYLTTTSTTAAEVVKTDTGTYQWNPETGRYDIKVDQASTESVQQKIESIDTQISDLQSIATQTDGMKQALSTTIMGNLQRSLSTAWDSSKISNFIGSVEQMLTSGTLTQLINAKAQGATFGALSDTELALISNSFSKIAYWRVKDDSGKVIGYNIDSTSFLNEIQKIITSTNKLKTYLSSSTSSSGFADTW